MIKRYKLLCIIALFCLFFPANSFASNQIDPCSIYYDHTWEGDDMDAFLLTPVSGWADGKIEMTIASGKVYLSADMTFFATVKMGNIFPINSGYSLPNVFIGSYYGLNFYIQNNYLYTTLNNNAVTGAFEEYAFIKQDFIAVMCSQSLPDPIANENYVFNTTYNKAFSESAVLAGTPSSQDKISQIEYFNGLGKSSQKVVIGFQYQGYTQKDVVNAYEYDKYGRLFREYLPYAPSDVNFGSFRSSAITETRNYYYQNFQAEQQWLNTKSVNPYTEIFFESSPLNHIAEVASPGKDWKGNALTETDHTVKYNYKTNSLNEVRNFKVQFQQVNGTINRENTLLTIQGYYPINTLYKNIVKNENWTTADGVNKTSEEFTDKAGRIILKRAYENGATYDTYYVYDIYDNLTYVIPPLASDQVVTQLAGSQLIAQSVVDGLCYTYHYDYRNRLVEKYIPDNGWTYMVYDRMDRLILTQDQNQRAKTVRNWQFIKYDQFSRVAYTGEYTNLTNRRDLQNNINTSGTPLYESRVKPLYAFNNGGAQVYYTNQTFPVSPLNLLTINYYDDYLFDLDGIALQTQTIHGTTITTNRRGLMTGGKIRTIDTNLWQTNVVFYDEKARPVWTEVKNNFLGTRNVLISQFSFTGKALTNTSFHYKGSNTIRIDDHFRYDSWDRLLKQEQQINSGAKTLIVMNNYDELGRLKGKKVGGTSGATLDGTVNYEGTAGSCQTVDYGYNIRGWLKSINDVNATLGSTSSTDLFAFKLNYNTITSYPSIPGYEALPLYNGNIAETQWKTKTDNRLRIYAYKYDALNRFKEANLFGPVTQGQLPPFNHREGNITYDKNGNITGLQRNGLKADALSFGTIDNLTYQYFPGSNKLQTVTDSAAETEGFNNGTSGTNADYEYDGSGNLTKDANKQITLIEYNHLNLPKKITFNGTSKFIEYVYDALGIKLQKKVTDGTNITTTQYSGSFVYENDLLQFFAHPEGYVKNIAGFFSYIYQYRDHLGNTRLSYLKNEQLSSTVPFDTSTGGFSAKGGATTLLNGGQLTVNGTQDYAGALKTISNSATVGQRFHFDFVVNRGTTGSVRVFISETNPADGTWNEYLVAVLEPGQQTLSFDHVVQQYPVIHLQIDKFNSGSSPVTTNFKLLDLKIYNAPLEIVEEDNYYPFGLKHKGYNTAISTNGNNVAQRYKYIGKEFTGNFDLNTYDFGARNYEPALGRWVNTDPLAEQRPGISTYNYCVNNPIIFIDPDGKDNDYFLNTSTGLTTEVITADSFDNLYTDGMFTQKYEKGDKIGSTLNISKSVTIGTGSYIKMGERTIGLFDFGIGRNNPDEDRSSYNEPQYGGVTTGLYLDLSGGEYSSFKWFQTVTKTDVSGNMLKGYPKIDGRSDTLPFYPYSGVDNGEDWTFAVYDRPNTTINNGGKIFRAELSLIGYTADGTKTKLFTWGFGYDVIPSKNIWSVTNLKLITEPSEYHMTEFNNLPNPK